MGKFRPLLLALCAISCREEAVTRSRVPKEPAPQAGVAAAPPDAQVAPRRGLRWTLPPGWTQAPGDGMRLATLTPPGMVKALGTVVVLPGGSGGALANANRWRGQIGLPPLDEKGLAAARATLAAPAGTVELFDFVSADGNARLIAAAVRSGESTWFFKLMGESADVASARGSFVALLSGLMPDASK